MATGERPPPNPKARDAVGGQPGRRLDSWKEIASWFERSEKTVRRGEQREGMPVHRLFHEKREPIVIFLIFFLSSTISELWPIGVDSTGDFHPGE
jgi:hypothetical protein